MTSQRRDLTSSDALQDHEWRNKFSFTEPESPSHRWPKNSHVVSPLGFGKTTANGRLTSNFDLDVVRRQQRRLTSNQGQIHATTTRDAERDAAGGVDDVTSTSTRVGVITFSNWAFVDVALGAHASTASLRRAVAGIRQRHGDTDTAAALRLLREEGFTSSAASQVSFTLLEAPRVTSCVPSQYNSTGTSSKYVPSFSDVLQLQD